jgi:hypothetical protein
MLLVSTGNLKKSSGRPPTRSSLAPYGAAVRSIIHMPIVDPFNLAVGRKIFRLRPEEF